MGLVHSSFIAYPTPRNLKLLLDVRRDPSFMLGAQIVTGIVLAMHYTPHTAHAFSSVEHIMRDGELGMVHPLCPCERRVRCSFIAVNIHMFRGLYFGSYKAPREVLWILGSSYLPPDDGNGLHGLRVPWAR